MRLSLNKITWAEAFVSYTRSENFVKLKTGLNSRYPCVSIISWRVGSEQSTRSARISRHSFAQEGTYGKTMVLSQDKMKKYAYIGTENEGRMYAS